MKRINMLCVSLLIVLTAVGVWVISLVTKGQLSTDIKLPPSAPVLSVESGEVTY